MQMTCHRLFLRSKNILFSEDKKSHLWSHPAASHETTPKDIPEKNKLVEEIKKNTLEGKSAGKLLWNKCHRREMKIVAGSESGPALIGIYNSICQGLRYYVFWN